APRAAHRSTGDPIRERLSARPVIAVIVTTCVADRRPCCFPPNRGAGGVPPVRAVVRGNAKRDRERARRRSTARIRAVHPRSRPADGEAPHRNLLCSPSTSALSSKAERAVQQGTARDLLARTVFCRRRRTWFRRRSPRNPRWGRVLVVAALSPEPRTFLELRHRPGDLRLCSSLRTVVAQLRAVGGELMPKRLERLRTSSAERGF